MALAAFTAGVYVWVGTPQALDGPIPVAQWEEPAPSESEALAPPEGPASGEAAAPTQAQIKGMASRLATRLQTQPDDVAGWRMLARSYETLGRSDEAVQAYQRVLALGARQGSCRVIHAARSGLSTAGELSATMASRSGLRVTGPSGDQSRVEPDQRAGLASRARMYSAWRAAKIA